MSNFAENMQNLQLHRISFLTPHLLGLLIPKMTNLKFLGIYMCQLLHMAEVTRLLDIIKTDRPRGRENQVSLDFFPMWHAGPAEPENPADGWRNYTGTYGVTWDNTWMNHPLAVWCIVKRAIKQAQTQGIDLVSKGTAFRQWLDKGLVWKVEETLQAILDPKTDIRVLTALVDNRNPDHNGNWRRFSSGGIRPEGWEPYVIPCSFVCHGCSQSSLCPRTNRIPNHRYLRDYKCNQCKLQVMGIFFNYHDIMELMAFHGGSSRAANVTCLGCKLARACQVEHDHFKHSKRRIMKYWLNDGAGGWNTADVDKALR